ARAQQLQRRFFFSSRRRHTRFSRDWSSDVCSSDLDERNGLPTGNGPDTHGLRVQLPGQNTVVVGDAAVRVEHALALAVELVGIEIGRAACREGGESSEAEVAAQTQTRQAGRPETST